MAQKKFQIKALFDIWIYLSIINEAPLRILNFCPKSRLPLRMTPIWYKFKKKTFGFMAMPLNSVFSRKYCKNSVKIEKGYKKSRILLNVTHEQKLKWIINLFPVNDYSWEQVNFLKSLPYQKYL